MQPLAVTRLTRVRWSNFRDPSKTDIGVHLTQVLAPVARTRAGIGNRNKSAIAKKSRTNLVHPAQKFLHSDEIAPALVSIRWISPIELAQQRWPSELAVTGTAAGLRLHPLIGVFEDVLR